jgi:hypothetical protein
MLTTVHFKEMRYVWTNKWGKLLKTSSELFKKIIFHLYFSLSKVKSCTSMVFSLWLIGSNISLIPSWVRLITRSTPNGSWKSYWFSRKWKHYTSTYLWDTAHLKTCTRKLHDSGQCRNFFKLFSLLTKFRQSAYLLFI